MTVSGIIIPGHQVASGGNGNPKFPGGTIRMQLPFFRERGLDLASFHAGTLNVDIAPWKPRLVTPKHTFRRLKWHPTEPAEDFSFVECQVNGQSGFIYHPHPETKPAHFQPGTVIELLMPFLEGVRYGDRIEVEVSEDQLAFHQ